ncbi:hypothetical protein [Nocardia puris]|uniref:Uncharacterized protein n=1 Tax=Nocardia puris TaxID=208602 RepID=A0A366E3A5_9NOCA|nr:hypothetical protein [Nocardia puris]RBO96856.1 hypothetical protein DFR74_101875 [Nocardia puris]
MTPQRRLLARLTVAAALAAAPLTALALPAAAHAGPPCAHHGTAACDRTSDYELPSMADPNNPISPMNPMNPVNPANPLYLYP